MKTLKINKINPAIFKKCVDFSHHRDPWLLHLLTETSHKQDDIQLKDFNEAAVEKQVKCQVKQASTLIFKNTHSFSNQSFSMDNYCKTTEIQMCLSLKEKNRKADNGQNCIHSPSRNEVLSQKPQLSRLKAQKVPLTSCQQVRGNNTSRENNSSHPPSVSKSKVNTLKSHFCMEDIHF